MRKFRHGRDRVLDAPHLPMAIYLTFVGYAMLITGPETTGALQYVLPDWLTYTWSAALGIGGTSIIFGVLCDNTRFESSGHALHLFGLMLATIVFTAEKTLEVEQSAALVCFAAMSVIRLHMLHRRREARVMVKNILKDDEAE